MKYKFALAYALIALITTVNAYSYSDQEKKDFMTKEITEITYHFGDSSVPPPYHRSYAIRLTADTATVSVDSYGEILATKQYAYKEDTLQKIIQLIVECKIRNCNTKKNKGCTGGTSESIWYNSNEEKIFHGSVYHCGGEDYGNLCGNVSKFADAMKALVPDLNELKN